ncbi:DNA-directed RNA polymerase subunit beta [Peptoniphilus asaccharolyticus DSM 20463]|uniref:DNA-directed RNA polymerase subunit beta n=1 Tax=Peptoniphilus asaccharolyticus DSM 20463 TaxID=573058 RepID=A0A1W1VKG2_PEPAS|nr:DNA-directed RNA polymerase subunit beta [Peptoniphilus asaccharolyticus]MBL7574416.1 DNA-directed RNA polymerase subunit beta [Peptoniphilus asaccharolyticus]SMB93561.1 DNA-directed RNA polymerase subunit beta [Peptoniphilus asaccharolyticus DSM 20463]
MAHPVKYGKRERMSFSRIPEVQSLPNLLEVQTASFDWLIREGLKEVFDEVSPIEDYSGNLILEFVDYYVSSERKYSIDDAKERDTNYSAPLKVKVRLINTETGEVKEQEVFMGDLPLMTPTGTFIINGSERVVVSQLVRSPGSYYKVETDKTGKKLYSATVIPNRGAWLEYETDAQGVINVRIDRTRKIPVTILMRAIGIESNMEITDILGESEALLKTLEKDSTSNKNEALLEIYKKLRPGEPPTVESAESLFENMFFDNRRYDLAHVGRYKFNKKLGISARIEGHYASSDVINPETGEIIVEEGTRFTEETAQAVENAGINKLIITVKSIREDEPDRDVIVIGNNFAYADDFELPFDLKELGFREKVYYPLFKQIVEEFEDDEEKLKQELKKNYRLLSPKHITVDDIIASVNYEFGLSFNVGVVDDIDHLGNRRIRSVGELLQNQFRIGVSRMERVIRERMTVQDVDATTPQSLINIRPVTAAIKEFFGSSQLSQFMDQNNPLSELTHKRRLSALGPGGLSRDRAGFEVRDVHNSHYGRMCPIETPEGPNIGLITSLTTYARINEYGFLETPYRKVKFGEGIVTDEIEYITADVEYEQIIAQSNELLDENGKFINDRVVARGHEGVVDIFDSKEVTYMDVSPQQIVAVGTAMIPFLENDDANRALMGANMQRQAVPLLKTEAPVIGTGIEYRAAKDSGVVIVSKEDGEIVKVDATEITVRRDSDGVRDKYELHKFIGANQGTTINQRPIVKKGQKVKKGEIIADGPSTDMGEMALGKNILIAFMNWEGYNYEDAMLVNKDLVIDDTLTSLHIEEYESEARDTKLGPEEITRDIPNVGDDMLKDLDERGIIRIGAEVKPGNILVGKVTPKGETELSAEERLLRAIFGEKAREVRDTSLRLPHGEQGIVVDVKTFTREAGDELQPGVNEMVRVFIATKRKIQVGDKMCGRHGNKGVISRVMPAEDMPYMPDGTPIQIVLNPLGVPSRMNLGQVLEVHLGLAARKLGWHVATPVFDGANEEDIQNALSQAGYPIDGKIQLRDGRTGEEFDHPVTVGYMYMLKLHHLVDEKIHARSTGPYSLVTQQPLGGKAQFGGQRFGEMEVWALEAYGASYTLQEMLTVKSDDIVGRVKTYEAIVKGENIPQPGVPESFKVLIKELQSLALEIKVLDEYGNDVDLEVDEDDLDRIDNISNNDEEIKELIENNQAPTQGAIKRISTDDIDALEEGYEENEEDELDGHYEEDLNSYDDSDDE